MSLRRIVARGLLAGAAGTAAMDFLWYRRYQADGGTSSFPAWEFQSPIDNFDDAPATARVGKIIAAKAGVTLPDEAASLTNNVVHWSTGLGWGVASAALRPLPGLGAFKAGVLAGLGAFATSYAVLPKLGVYKPITEYDSKTLWKDFSGHLVFGSALGAAGLVLRGGRR